MDFQTALLGLPMVLAILLRLMPRRRRRRFTGLVRELCDLVSLRMVLRDSEPEERSELLAAHQVWRTEAKEPGDGPPPHRRQQKRNRGKRSA
ncbi:hypothetical protein [Streptomyces sp. 6-11-2]|uniref:hypothetical protein n=1 Tax=Streptomyces sp. 6-11-2 TaxID=2585753 RepID=UPI001144ADA0|nr:hypothetical protein [Streptomyces sp. 6-11-2]GED90740.1 hypothetical protein TNCT6_78250 [Streptomyces sp. 6-11-2]